VILEVNHQTFIPKGEVQFSHLFGVLLNEHGHKWRYYCESFHSHIIIRVKRDDNWIAAHSRLGTKEDTWERDGLRMFWMGIQISTQCNECIDI